MRNCTLCAYNHFTAYGLYCKAKRFV